ncbi:NADH:ubiquinone oxidoreductase subunit L [Klebsiella variicola]|uniref:NADH:ubiquinone oxidoreductase subunit L n=1 Tax=Klebsiella variicola TaxID=244366 RepID=A0A7H4MPK2_KLEVA|nr:NADH:ubiquinone oxidoreductase subunit L [Klebsiella variicola]
MGSVGLAALVTAYVGVDFFANGKQAVSVPLWNWMSVGDFNIGFNLVLDGLSLTMLSVVTGVGFLIHMFASWYMAREEGYSRFFAYTNLFIASMVVLVLADNLLLMYLGWEGVGSLFLPADRLLLYRSEEQCRSDESLRGHPRRRRVPRLRAVHSL